MTITAMGELARSLERVDLCGRCATDLVNFLRERERSEALARPEAN
jgi:hypothetical protein